MLVFPSLELLYFVLTVYNPHWFILVAGYQAIVDASWLIFFDLIMRVGKGTRFCTNYYSTLTLLRNSLTWPDLRVDVAFSWLFGYQPDEVTCNTNCVILWWHNCDVKIWFLPLQFCKEILMGYWIFHIVSMHQGCRYP